jgi:thioredoxin-like negative regulator of GroEL
MVKRVSFSSDTKGGAAEAGSGVDTTEFIRTMGKIEEWNEILDSQEPVVFQCSTSWCRPCQVLKPLMIKKV